VRCPLGSWKHDASFDCDGSVVACEVCGYVIRRPAWERMSRAFSERHLAAFIANALVAHHERASEVLGDLPLIEVEL
jgi:hypothetical protein